MLKPVDVVVILKLQCWPEGTARTYQALADRIGISSSTAHTALKSAQRSGLVSPRDGRPIPLAVLEFLEHGLKYCFPVVRGGLGRGWPTGAAAEPLKQKLPATGQPPPVWPDAEGPVLGLTIEPLHPCVVRAAREDACLYELLALADAVRERQAREASLAIEELRSRFRRAHEK